MIKQIRTWCVITAKKKLSIKAHFLDPWSNTTDAHVTTFARKLDRRQVKCGATVAEDNKVDHFMSQMYACGLFEAKLLDNWEEITNKSWWAKLSQFTKQYAKEQRKLERE